MILQKSKIYEMKIFDSVLSDEDFITICHEDKTSFYSEGLDYAVRGDYKKLISYFIPKKQLLWWKMPEAAQEGDTRILDFLFLKAITTGINVCFLRLVENMKI